MSSSAFAFSASHSSICHHKVFIKMSKRCQKLFKNFVEWQRQDALHCKGVALVTHLFHCQQVKCLRFHLNKKLHIVAVALLRMGAHTAMLALYTNSTDLLLFLIQPHLYGDSMLLRVEPGFLEPLPVTQNDCKYVTTRQDRDKVYTRLVRWYKRVSIE